jgi:hypothetical protein
LETEIVAINRRLDYMTTLLNSASQYQQMSANGSAERSEISEEASPFKLLGTRAVMTILGLDSDFARRLRRVERAALHTSGVPASRLYVVTHQQALT